MRNTLIIGYGSPLHRDDGLGWRVVEELERTSATDGISLLACHQLTPELANPVSVAQSVIFVDAVADIKPGEIFFQKIGPESDVDCFSHKFTPAAVLALASELYGACPNAWMIGVGGESFEIGEGLSATVTGSLPALVAKILELSSSKHNA